MIARRAMDSVAASAMYKPQRRKDAKEMRAASSIALDTSPCRDEGSTIFAPLRLCGSFCMATTLIVRL
jgi:hypothetical protein